MVVPNGAVCLCTCVCGKVEVRRYCAGTGTDSVCRREPCSRSVYWLAVALCFLAWVLVYIGKAILLTVRQYVSDNK